MEITNVKVWKLAKAKSNLKAFAQVTFDDCFVVTGLKVIEGEKDYFVAMPSQKGSDEEYRDVAFPVTSEFRAEINAVVLEAYENADEAKPKKKYGKK